MYNIIMVIIILPVVYRIERKDCATLLQVYPTFLAGELYTSCLCWDVFIHSFSRYCRNKLIVRVHIICTDYIIAFILYNYASPQGSASHSSACSDRVSC